MKTEADVSTDQAPRQKELYYELLVWLDKQVITPDNIGEIRRRCLLPWDSEWNGFVRDETAAREQPPSVSGRDSSNASRVSSLTTSPPSLSGVAEIAEEWTERGTGVYANFHELIACAETPVAAARLSIRHNASLSRATEKLEARCNERAAFKDFVHRRLDTAGVPKEFPDGAHTKEGCRIGDRLDWVLERAEKLEAERGEIAFRISKLYGERIHAGTGFVGSLGWKTAIIREAIDEAFKESRNDK